MRKSLLILAIDHDIHADAVHDLVTQQGHTSYRLDPEVEWPPVNGRVKVSQRAAQNVATLG